jgi:phytoene synthase
VKALTSELGAPPGSLRYFAVLFAPPPARPLLEALYGFDAEIRTTLSISHDAAHARLQWWRSEIDRLAAGRPTHPLAVALRPLRERGDVQIDLLHESLVAADLDLARMAYASWEELDAYCYRAAGSLQTLAAAVLAGERPVTETERRFAQQLGSAQRQAEMIRDFRYDLGRGRLYLPLQVVESVGLDPLALEKSPDLAEAAGLLAPWRARVSRSLRALPEFLPDRAQRSAQRHGLVLAALHEKLMERAARPAARRTAERVEVGPLARLWTAWRTAVRYT